jgi:hypothetical protein
MAGKFIATAYERAIQLTPALHFRDNREPNWMAHTPVGHDSLFVSSIE